ncbi:deaminase domain-containing protein [Bacillus stercoris]|uniref:deaminase domain-containing protein n=1 Tax=Bacillus stercoris TaxID=2054641 RepID=UPI003F775DC1
MERVLKYNCRKQQKGITYKIKAWRFKSNTLAKARRAIKGNAENKRRFHLEYPRFISGNDAMLEFFPKKNKKNMVDVKGFTCYANSGVNYKHAFISSLNNYVLKPEKGAQIFKPFNTNRRREINNGTPRQYDTEFKLLEYVATKIHPDTIGQIMLYTYYEPCLSCDHVIIEFVRRFPNIKIDIFFEEEYTHKGWDF